MEADRRRGNIDLNAAGGERFAADRK